MTSTELEKAKEHYRGIIEPLDLPEPEDGEIVAVGVPIFESVKRDVWHGFTRFMGKMAREIPEGNLWLLKPHNERLSWPLSNFWIVVSMLVQEEIAGRKADWLFYVEDDILLPRDVYAKLRAAADPEKRPFMAAVGYCRNAPYWPGVTQKSMGDRGWETETQWQVAPPAGIHAVHTAPLCATLLHRSIFDRIAEPWFNTVAPVSTGGGVTGPARWFCLQCHKAGIVPHVCCDVDIGHALQPLMMDRRKSEQWNASR